MQDLDSLWDFSDPAASESRFRDVLNSDPADHEARTQLARSLGLQRRYDEAHAELDLVDAHVTDLPTRLRVRSLLERGRALNSSGSPEAALPVFQEAVSAARICNEPGLEIDAMHMVAIADSDNSLEINLAAIARAKELADPRATRWLASLHNNCGWSYFDQGRLQQALENFEAAALLREEQGNAGATDIARWCVARVLRAMGRQTEALAILDDIAPRNESDPYTAQELALCKDDLGQPSQADAEQALNLFGPDAGLPKIRARLESLASGRRSDR